MYIFVTGGHTKELLSLIEHLGGNYQPRHYVLANTDKISEAKIHQVETDKCYKVCYIYVSDYYH